MNAILTTQEQRATLQCIWQVLAANPNSQESSMIQSKLVKDWACMKDVDMSDALSLQFQLGCEIKPWIIVAIQEDPYDSFATIASMPNNKKLFVKQIILDIIETGDNYSQRAPYAHTLFNNCNIPFIVKGHIFPNGQVGNKIV